MTDHDTHFLLHRTHEPPDLPPSAIEDARSSVLRRMQRRRRVVRLLPITGAGIVLVACVVVLLARSPANDRPEVIAAGPDSSISRRPGPPEPLAAIDGAICGAKPSPAASVGLVFNAPRIVRRPTPASQTAARLSIEATNEGTESLRISFAHGVPLVLTDGNRIDSSDTSLASVQAVTILPGEKVTLDAWLPFQRCDETSLLSPGSYSVAAAVTASVAGGPPATVLSEPFVLIYE